MECAKCNGTGQVESPKEVHVYLGELAKAVTDGGCPNYGGKMYYNQGTGEVIISLPFGQGYPYGYEVIIEALEKVK